MMAGDRILVTGANGFVGTALTSTLYTQGRTVHAAVRYSRPDARVSASRLHVLGDIASTTEWDAVCCGIDCIVHLAAHAHVPGAGGSRDLSIYRRVNVDGTLGLAHAAARQGVRRLVFLSSIKVNGESTQERPFREADDPKPEDAYGISKWEAEQALARFARDATIEVVVLRAPLVYGPGVKGNFLRLLRLVARGTPLPFSRVTNRRSLIYLANLTAAIVACMDKPQAAGRLYLVSDGHDMSTPMLIRGLADALGVPARLFPCPVAMLNLAAGLVGKKQEVRRLTESLQVDPSRINSELGWQPVQTVDDGLASTARWYESLSRPDS